MNLNFTYVDEAGNNIPGECLYETKIDGKSYAICNLHYGPDKNTVCACKRIGEWNNKQFVRLDETDNKEAIMAHINRVIMEAK